jgi:hypothetical protein
MELYPFLNCGDPGIGGFDMLFYGKITGHFLTIDRQIKHWRRANRKMGWKIPRDEFRRLEAMLSSMTFEDRQCLIGTVLCYGFGHDGDNGCDAVLSGRRAWQYAARLHGLDTWQCQYLRLDQPEYIRLRPKAPVRPKGFYLADIRLPAKVQAFTVSQFRKRLSSGCTGLGPEGIQTFCITHPHLAMQMNAHMLPFIVLADYDVAPYGCYDFFDAVQIFCSNKTLGLGIGNIDRNYPLFGIAEMAADFKKMTT